MADDIELCLHTPRADCNCTTPSKPTPARSLPPHAPCRLQPMRKSPVARTLTFASTRPVQIATAIALVKSHKRQDFASTRPVQIATRRRSHPLYSACFASTRPVQIATIRKFKRNIDMCLCLHTPRADCNAFTKLAYKNLGHFASTRPVQIATEINLDAVRIIALCLHTPRADCNTEAMIAYQSGIRLCLHTPRADCNASPLSSSILRMLCLHTPRADCNGRNAQNCNMHFSERVLSR